jgi:hypothetical protein
MEKNSFVFYIFSYTKERGFIKTNEGSPHIQVVGFLLAESWTQH